MSQFRITGIDINHLGVFDKLELKFSHEKPKDKAEVHIFTGINGTGKTTLLNALTYFDYVFNKEYWNRAEKTLPEGGETDLLKAKGWVKKWSGKKKPPPITLHYGNHSISFPSEIKEGRRGETFFDIYYNNIYNNVYRDQDIYFFHYGGNRFLFQSHVEPFKDVSYNPLPDALDVNRSPVNPSFFQWIANTWTRAAIANMKKKNGSKGYLNIVKKIEEALGEIIARKVEFIVDEGDLQVKLKLDDEDVEFDQLADGYKSLINWFGDLIFRLGELLFFKDSANSTKTFVLFLDEIEVHLHPAAQRRILPVIQKLFPTAQIFITTHSPFIIGSVQGAQVYKFKLEKGKSQYKGTYKSEDGWSYRHIMAEILGVEEDYGFNVMNDLNKFDSLYKVLLKHPNDPRKKEFSALANSLAKRSPELSAIIGSELSQLQKRTEKFSN